MFIILPYFAPIIPRQAALEQLNVPFRFTAITLSQSSSRISIRKPSFITPAQFTSRRGTPSSAFILSNAWATWAESDTSAFMVMDFPIAWALERKSSADLSSP